MSRVILRAENHNWGLICFGVDWDKAVWKVRNDASFSLTVFYESDEKEKTGILSPEEYNCLVRLLEEPWSEEKVDACDGEAWEFKLYGKRGALEKHRPLGYIYGLEPFESIVRILREYWDESLNTVT